MSLRNIGIVYRKELVDSLRDRRTVISMIVVPIFVMPLLTIGIGGVLVSQVGRAMEEVPESDDPRRPRFAEREKAACSN